MTNSNPLPVQTFVDARGTTNVLLNTKVVTLVDAFGDINEEEATQELLTSLGLEFTLEPSFYPLTEQESHLAGSDGILMVGGGLARLIRVVLIDGKKYVNLSDDDYYDESEEREYDPNDNLNPTKAIMLTAATATGGIYKDVITKFSDGSIKEYEVDAYIPIEFFKQIKSKFQFGQFLQTCDFSSTESIESAFNEALSK
ncbi:hypothetical protein OTK49_20765 [Vibrio coralliirubri]|uniref:hypothetical protein n=1 Tax=Vibrio coralliirubri TaxID=1516159 RepID=UPI0022844DB6|nr:hypothetical protein [Vibrio coralliirubri]MCY9864951.1 hypothetical protein [Vibrio coralliirubri]